MKFLNQRLTMNDKDKGVSYLPKSLIYNECCVFDKQLVSDIMIYSQIMYQEMYLKQESKLPYKMLLYKITA